VPFESPGPATGAPTFAAAPTPRRLVAVPAASSLSVTGPEAPAAAAAAFDSSRAVSPAAAEGAAGPSCHGRLRRARISKRFATRIASGSPWMWLWKKRAGTGPLASTPSI
jgi:hypothetical protein